MKKNKNKVFNKQNIIYFIVLGIGLLALIGFGISIGVYKSMVITSIFGGIMIGNMITDIIILVYSSFNKKKFIEKVDTCTSMLDDLAHCDEIAKDKQLDKFIGHIADEMNELMDWIGDK